MDAHRSVVTQPALRPMSGHFRNQHLSATSAMPARMGTSPRNFTVATVRSPLSRYPATHPALSGSKLRNAQGRLAGLDDTAFCDQLTSHLQGLLGDVVELTPRHVFPLHGLMARQLAANRTMLLGEAAHVMPPIGAQGLNLGLRDAACLVDIVFQGRSPRRRDTGGAAALRAYENARRFDVNIRSHTVGLLNRSLISTAFPIKALRGVGLHLLDKSPALRQSLMREGIGERQNLPSLMQSQQP